MLFKVEVEVENTWRFDNCFGTGFFKTESSAIKYIHKFKQARERFKTFSTYKDRRDFLGNFNSVLKNSDSKVHLALFHLEHATAIRVVRYELGTLSYCEVL